VAEGAAENAIVAIPILLQMIFLKTRRKTQTTDSYHLLKTVIFYSRTHQVKMLLTVCLIVLSLISIILSFCLEEQIFLCFLIVKNFEKNKNGGNFVIN